METAAIGFPLLIALIAVALQLLSDYCPPRPVRLLGVGAHELLGAENAYPEQLRLE